MRSLLVAVIAGGAVLATVGAGHAGALGIPRPSLPSPYVSIADQEMTVMGTAVNLRSKPSTAGKVLAKLNNGAKVMVVGTSGSWTHVKYKNLDGYVSSRYLK